MYDLSEIRGLTDGWWAGLRRNLGKVGIRYLPRDLLRPKLLTAHWLDESLCLSQTCGYPLTHELRDRVTLVGTPSYAVPGCRGIDYSSAILVNENATVASVDELRGGTAACNATDSHSGYNALRAMIAPLARDGRFFSEIRITGSHAGSAKAVGVGEADVCAVDAVTYALTERYAPESLEGTRLLTWSSHAPGLPYITRSTMPPVDLRQLREGIAAAFADPMLGDVRSALFLSGVECPSDSDYERIIEQEQTSKDLGYPELY